MAAPAAAPTACRQQFTAEQIKTCSALDYKNGVLTAQLVDLEEKVKSLQGAIDHKPELAAVAPPAAVKPAGAPKPAGAKKRDKAGLPWLLIGGLAAGVLVLLTLLVWILRRRKAKARPGEPAEPRAPGRLAGLLARFKRNKAGAEMPAPEPKLE